MFIMCSLLKANRRTGEAALRPRRRHCPGGAVRFNLLACYNIQMTDNVDYITIDAEKADLQSLLETVRTQQRPVRIRSGGKPVADVMPVILSRFGPSDPRLKAEMLVQGHELTTEEDWPEHLR
jgi:hypothetical protein